MDPDTIIMRSLSSCIFPQYVRRRIKNSNGGLWCMEGGGGQGVNPPPLDLEDNMFLP